ncbi:MAG: hypothetical protein BroJett011_35810 [Chloroflexota bacterium]|nr:MAG: hypothetical protein BroJett011_35810 [Chloroflexota bacterium]
MDSVRWLALVSGGALILLAALIGFAVFMTNNTLSAGNEFTGRLIYPAESSGSGPTLLRTDRV